MGEVNAANDIMQEYIESLDRSLEALMKEHNLYIVDSRWEIEDDYSEDNFGEIDMVEVRVSSSSEVDIGDISIDEDGNVDMSGGTGGSEEKLADKLCEEMAETFNIERECVRVEILI